MNTLCTTGVTDFVRIHSILKWGDSSRYNNSQYKQVVCVCGGGGWFFFLFDVLFTCTWVWWGEIRHTK